MSCETYTPHVGLAGILLHMYARKQLTSKDVFHPTSNLDRTQLEGAPTCTEAESYCVKLTPQYIISQCSGVNLHACILYALL